MRWRTEREDKKMSMTMRTDARGAAAALVTMFVLFIIWPYIQVQMTESLHTGCATYNEAYKEYRVCQGTDHPTDDPMLANPLLPLALLHVVGENYRNNTSNQGNR
jgi:hypothetical protein